MLMNRLSEKKNKQEKLGGLLPYAGIAALVVASYFVLFHTGVVLMPSAQAQGVDVGRIGEQAVGQVAEAAGEHEAQLGQTEQELAKPEAAEGAAEPAGEGAVATPGELPPGETAEPVAAERGTPVFVGQGSPYYASSEDLGGTRLEDLGADELRGLLLQIPEIQAFRQVQIREAVVDVLLPCVQRFQVMIRPPVEYEGLTRQHPPWLSEARRYSPFDPVGVQGPPVARAHAVPPFRPIPGLEAAAERGPEITAQMVANNLELVGVMGELGHYLAIINVAGDQKVLGVGEEVGRRGEYAYMIDEISLGQVKIIREGRPEDAGIMFFTEREGSGISEVSISY